MRMLIDLKHIQTSVFWGNVANTRRIIMKTLTAEQLWDIYAEAVGGKTFDGKPLPKFDELGKQQVGWLAIANAISEDAGTDYIG